MVLEAREPSLRSDGTPVSEVVTRLEAGGPLGKLVRPGELAPADLFAALAQAALGDDDSPGPALIRASHDAHGS